MVRASLLRVGLVGVAGRRTTLGWTDAWCGEGCWPMTAWMKVAMRWVMARKITQKIEEKRKVRKKNNNKITLISVKLKINLILIKIFIDIIIYIYPFIYTA